VVPPGREYQILSSGSAVDGSIWRNLFTAAADPTSGNGQRVVCSVWIGFIFLLDPINNQLGLPSLIDDFRQGRRSHFYALLLSGFVCGWLWEFWNYWAAAKWQYTFPMFQQWKIFEMPIPGYLGFFPFALECFAMYVTAAWSLRLLKRQPQDNRHSAW